MIQQQGLPKEWEQLLADSGISKQDQQDHPQAVIDVIEFYSETQQQSRDAVWNKINNKYAQSVNPLLRNYEGSPSGSPQLGFHKKTPPPKPPRSGGTPESASPSPPPKPLKKKVPPSIPPRPSLLQHQHQSQQQQPQQQQEPSPEKRPVMSPPNGMPRPMPPPLKPKPAHFQTPQKIIPGYSSPSAGTISQPIAIPLQQAPPIGGGAPPAPVARPKKKQQITTEQVMERLRHTSKEIDPLGVYMNLIKIGQG